MPCVSTALKDVLGKVIEELDLNTVWGRKYGVGKLKTAESLVVLKRQLALRPGGGEAFARGA